MKLRTKLVIAFFALAVVPLASIVIYSYQTSIEAFRAAVEAESQHMAEGMNQRMAEVRDELDSFLGRASRFAIADQSLSEPDIRHFEAERLRLKQEKSEIAALVETCEFIPAPFPIEVHGTPVEIEMPELELSEPVIPAPPPVERFVFRFNHDEEDCGDCDDDNHEHNHEANDETQWVENLIFEGTRIVAKAVIDPEGFEAEVSERTPELTADVMEFVFTEGSEMIERAIEDPEAFEREVSHYSKRVKQRLLETIPSHLRLTEAELADLEARRERADTLIGRRFSYEIREGERVLGTMRAQVSASELMTAVLDASRREEGEVPFAVDSDGTVHTLEAGDEQLLEQLAVTGTGGISPQACPDDWIVVKTEDPVSKTTFGIARPVGKGLASIRRTAARNMAIGLFVVAIAGCGVMPLTRRMTRNLSTLTDASEALARGELETRVPIRSHDEIGQLASAFNRMAADLDDNRNRLLEEERLRREQEVETRLLEVEHQRKTDELEAARLFQLSLLPDQLPRHPGYRIAVAMRTATEVGGDYYDFRETDDGCITVALGDATGHGAAAGTMVTIAKSLFTSAKDFSPAHFLQRASSVVRTMRLGRMTMALALARLEPQGLTASMAGMPPLLIHRKSSGDVEEVVIPGPPLGGFRDSAYHEVKVSLGSGDTVLMLSDGFPELLDESDEPLGYDQVRAHFAVAAAGEPEEIIEALEKRAEEWRGARAQADDISFVVLRKA